MSKLDKLKEKKVSVTKLVFAGLLALASVFVMDVPVGDAINIAFDEDAAKEACVKLLEAEDEGESTEEDVE